MAGGRLELTYGISCAYIWFTAFADFLISWDPFYYEIDIGVSVGATFSIEICFFGVASTSASPSPWAPRSPSGPAAARHGHGRSGHLLRHRSLRHDANQQPPYITDFTGFTKYLHGDQPGNSVPRQRAHRPCASRPAGGQPSPGTQDKPWKMVSEFSFQCDTKMPATSTNDFIFGNTGLSGRFTPSISPR